LSIILTIPYPANKYSFNPNFSLNLMEETTLEEMDNSSDKLKK
jgi:hypothetical protein